LRRQISWVSLMGMKNLLYPIVRRITVLSLLAIASYEFLYAYLSKPIRSNYTKYEYEIPMRDGKRLFTAVYVPKDTGQRYPIMLNRTPYGVAPYGEDSYPSELGPSEELADDGFIFAYQDVRGRMMSEGEFINMTPQKDQKKGSDEIDESSDAYDTIEWMIHNIPNNNGNVGIWGISYPGFYAAAGTINAHPALKAVSPQAPIADWFIGDDFHHNGAFYLAHAFGFLSSFGYPRAEPTKSWERHFEFPTPDGYDFYLKLGPLANANKLYLKGEVSFWNKLMRHGNYDEFWQSRNIRPHLRNIRPAVMTVGGWFDAEDLFGTLAVYNSIEESSPGAFNILVMGPWYHGGWARSTGESLGSIRFGSQTSIFYRKEIEFPFFKHFLKGDVPIDLPEAYVFATGSNEWQREDRWPPPRAKPGRLYFHAGGRLSWYPSEEDSENAYDEYISDPNKPVPYINGISTHMTHEHMVDDQRFASRRTDVLTYETDALTRDLKIAGPILCSLNVSTSGTDSDFVVKLIDVYPDDTSEYDFSAGSTRMSGFQQLVRGELFRGKFRNSFTCPEPFVPWEITQIEYRMPDIFHTFRKGHRLMVQVQSSWFPLVDRNPQQFVDIYNAKEADFKKATQRIYHSRNKPSFITLNKIK
jgi:putative CocE/NonD family hydrolase